MNIPLKVLIEANECFALMREKEGEKLNNKDFMRCLKAGSAFSAHIEWLMEDQSVEVTA